MALLVCCWPLHQESLERQPRRARHRYRHLVTFGVSPELNGYTPERSKQFYERLEDELDQISRRQGRHIGGRSVACGQQLGNGHVGGRIQVRSRHRQRLQRQRGRARTISRRWAFACSPGASSRAPTRWARRRWRSSTRPLPGSSTSGKTPSASAPHPTATAELDTQIVGLVQDAKYSEVRDAVPPIYFTPYRQDDRVGQNTFYVRTSIDAEQFLAERAQGRRRARSQPARRESADHAATGARQRVSRSHDQHAVGRLRHPRHDPCRRRAVRRARLHGRAAHTRNRIAHGTRRRARSCARHGPATGRGDDRSLAASSGSWPPSGSAASPNHSSTR